MVKDDIVQRLQNGENIEDIAAELTDAINKANDEYKTIQAAKEKAAQAAADKVKTTAEDKKARAQAILDWLKGTDLVNYKVDAATGSTVRSMLELLFDYYPVSVRDSEAMGRLAEALQILSMGMGKTSKLVDALITEDPKDYEYLNPESFFDMLGGLSFGSVFDSFFNHFS